MNLPWSRLLLFLAVFAMLHLGYTWAFGGTLERFVIEQLTVRNAAMLLNWLDPQLGVAAQGARLTAPGGGLQILGGCEGTDVALLLCSALLVAHLPWRQRLLGLALGLALVFVLNQLRVLALFHAFRRDRQAFELLHGSVLPLLMVIAAATFYLYWMGRSAPSQR
jgi:exosortase family protein XrtM